ncbi:MULTISPECIES: hypothetical protein [Actinomadura]|uniref:Uncharacterized protein n=1 Tax=Actinomadura yumaensis TaxID=111807 RepID=A0ABW2CN27_9ACTN|nr:hypothetical protein [Actinomadura sp. J1-007]MWK36817.1 hypothetical protein [Actinomadura sp. J1-007]
MRITRRLVAAAAAAALAGPLLSMPSAHAAGAYTCFSGERTPAQNGYDLTANGCDGGSGADVLIRVMVGPAAGLHRCRTSFSWNGFLSAQGCREER